MRRNLSAAVVLLAVTTLSACSKPPAEAISAAEAAQQAAMAAGVAEYAPEAMNAVSEAKAALDAELAAQGEKMSLTRSYSHAEELAAAFKSAAEQATASAAAAKEQAKADATTMIGEGRMALDSAMAMLAAAPVGKGSRADLAAMKADLEAAGMSLTEAEAALTGELYLEAKSKAAAAHEVIGRVTMAVEQARGMTR
jgi:hypothetical protein